jgi:hypothetical protein
VGLIRRRARQLVRAGVRQRQRCRFEHAEAFTQRGANSFSSRMA